MSPLNSANATNLKNAAVSSPISRTRGTSRANEAPTANNGGNFHKKASIQGARIVPPPPRAASPKKVPPLLRPPPPSPPALYRYALHHRWKDVMRRAASHPKEASYIDPNDGSTALHLAVISRLSQTDTMTAQPYWSQRRSLRDIWGSSSCFESPSAPLKAIDALMSAYPSAALVRCRHHGYTPLAYACLVPAPPPKKDTNEKEGEGSAGVLHSVNEEEGISSSRSSSSSSLLPRPPSGMIGLDNEAGNVMKEEALPRPPSGLFSPTETAGNEDSSGIDMPRPPSGLLLDSPNKHNDERSRQHPSTYTKPTSEAATHIHHDNNTKNNARRRFTAPPLSPGTTSNTNNSSPSPPSPLSSSPRSSDSKSILQDMEDVVRLLLKRNKHCASVLTSDGLSPVEIHIVSYSQTHGDDDDFSPEDIVNESRQHGIRRRSTTNNSKKRTTASVSRLNTTGVLRALLEADPTLAQSRPASSSSAAAAASHHHHHHHHHEASSSSTTMGPLELLYRCNAPSFLAAVEAEDIKRPPGHRYRRGSDRPWYGDLHKHPLYSMGGRPSQRNFSNDETSFVNWWAWKWCILLLKYGTLHRKKRGVMFQALHAAASVWGCPAPILILAARAFPRQTRDTDVNSEEEGNLPLHTVASWDTNIATTTKKNGSRKPDMLLSEEEEDDEEERDMLCRKEMALLALLEECPEAAKIKNKKGQIPLSVAIHAGTTWEGGIRVLAEAFPEGISVRDDEKMGGLYPFMVAASVASIESSKGQSDVNDIVCSFYDRKKSGGGGGGYVAAGLMGRLVEALSAAPPPNSQRRRSSLLAAERKSLQRVQTVYNLLRADPGIVGQFFIEEEEEWDDEPVDDISVFNASCDISISDSPSVRAGRALRAG